MDTNDITIIFLFILAGVAILSFVKLRAQKKRANHLSVENQRLLAENALFEANHLKFQLQPHTINNILANLKVFANKLNKGMDSLSETLDYILYKGDSTLVSVRDEKEFIEKYLQLHDLFISEIDSVHFDTSKIEESSSYYTTACIPHLITAHFLENAFKHGDINHPEFLKIKVSLTGSSFYLSVTNKIKKQASNGREGIGLKNMRKRLELLKTGKHEINQSCNEHEYHSTLLIELPK